MIHKLKNNNKDGVTLLELLITISIISVLSLLSFTSFTAAINAEYSTTAAKQLSYAIEKARYYAKSNGTTTYIKFNTNSDTYIIKTPDANGKSLTDQNRFDGFSGKMPDGTKVIDTTCNYFYYYVDGLPVSETSRRTPLSSDCFVLVGVTNSYTKIVRVNSKTGKVSYE